MQDMYKGHVIARDRHTDQQTYSNLAWDDLITVKYGMDGEQRIGVIDRSILWNGVMYYVGK